MHPPGSILVVHHVNNHHNLPENLYCYDHHYILQHQPLNLPQDHLVDILILSNLDHPKVNLLI